MVEVTVNTGSMTEVGFELTITEANHLISNGYSYTDKTYEVNDTYTPVATMGVYGDIIIKSVRKEHIKK